MANFTSRWFFAILMAMPIYSSSQCVAPASPNHILSWEERFVEALTRDRQQARRLFLLAGRSFRRREQFALAAAAFRRASDMSRDVNATQFIEDLEQAIAMYWACDQREAAMALTEWRNNHSS